MVGESGSPITLAFMRKTFFISLCISLQLCAASVWAGWFGTDFSAELVEGTPQAQSVRGMMYVDAGRVRTEIGQGDRQLVEIIDPLKGLAWVLDVSNKLYQVRSVPVVTPETARTNNPCDGVAGAECSQYPEETINGRRAIKWSLRFNGQERVQWNDARHGFPIQVVESGKVVMAMAFLGDEKLNGRSVERWHALQYSAGQIVETEQWYDPQLNIAIRQQAKDGTFRALRNIQLGHQSDALFTLPQGYRLQEAVSQ